MAPDTGHSVAAIYNAGRVLREYARGGRLPSIGMARLRAAAIRDLGLAVRAAFNESEDFEPLVIAFFDALNHRDDWQRF